MTTSVMTPREIVHELDKHIIGQNSAKRSVAIALRNRYRRMQVPNPLCHEITPKNILMIGPTGVGKTEIARRLAKLAKAPFLKVEATKFTEVGYVGRDVESIIRDLADIAYKITREEAASQCEQRAYENAIERILSSLVPSSTTQVGFSNEPSGNEPSAAKDAFREKLLNGELDDTEIEMQLSANPIGVEIMAPPGMEEMTSQLQGMFQNLSGDKLKTRKLKVKEALKLAKEEEADKLINEEETKIQAVERLEQTGIVFLDEVDKVTQRSDARGGDVSREGVQRDLLPLVEGCTVSTKYGMIKTDHILFIASGAFHISKPSDLIPELQGRLPIRVELNALTTGDFERILQEPDAALTKQYTALMATESVKLDFTPDGIARVAQIAFEMNERMENIGARRLHTVMERLLEQLSFEACDLKDHTLVVDKDYVNEQLSTLVEDQDLSQYIL